MKPSSGLLTQRPDLSSFFEFDLEASYQGFVAHAVVPILGVDRQAGNFGKIPDEELIQYAPDLERATGSGYSRSRTKFTNDTYSCTDYGHEEPVDDYEQQMFADYGDSELIATMRCSDVILRAAEARVATMAQGGGVAGQAVANGAWTAANSTPIDDVRSARTTVRNATGVAPDSMVMDWQVWQILINHAQIVDRVKYNGVMDARAGMISKQALATCFDLRQILVAGDGTMKRLSDQTLAKIWDHTQVTLFKAPMSKDVKEPCFGRTFLWKVNGIDPVNVETYREESIKSTIIRAEHWTHEKLLYGALARRITGVSA